MRVGTAVELRINSDETITGQVVEWTDEQGVIDSDLIEDDEGVFKLRIIIDLTANPTIISKVKLLSVSWDESGKIITSEVL